MRSSVGVMLLLGMISPLLAQNKPVVSQGHLEVAITYNAIRPGAPSGDRFWLQGGSVQLEGKFFHGLGAVADVTGQHTANMHGSGVGLDLVTATFGPRYTWQPAHRRYAFFGQALAGEANGFNSIFPNSAGADNSANGMALKVGGGINYALLRRLAVRAVEVDWLRTQLPNSTTNVQNSLQLGAGLVYLF